MATQLGQEGFEWFIGVVEDRDDPLKQGRVRVRAYGIHGDKVEIPVSSIPWATVLMPGFSASSNQVGISSTGLQLGSVAIGFFMDGKEAQQPIVLGSMPGKGDIPKLATGQNTINKQPVAIEPSSAYNAKYPFNKVHQTESGHVIEIDDTPNFERMHTFHKSGTYTEIDSSGRRVNKIVGDDYEIVVKDKNVYIQGALTITAKGNITINGDIKVNGSITATGDVIGGGISLVNHTHPDPQGGDTGKPG